MATNHQNRKPVQDNGAQNAPKRDEAYSITTESLGLARANAKELIGTLLTQQDISRAVIATLVSAGVPKEDIRTVRVGCFKEKKTMANGEVKLKYSPKIVAEVKASAVRKKSGKEENPWYMLDEGDEPSEGKSLNKRFTSALEGKMFYKHFDNKTVVRGRGKKKHRNGTKYVKLEINPEIFIAFAYNFDLSDPYFAIRCNRISFDKADKEAKHLDKKARNAYYLKRQEFIEDKMEFVTFAVIARLDNKRFVRIRNEIMKSVIDAVAPGTEVDFNKIMPTDKLNTLVYSALTSGDYHPNQAIYGVEDPKPNKKHKNK